MTISVPYVRLATTTQQMETKIALIPSMTVKRAISITGHKRTQISAPEQIVLATSLNKNVSTMQNKERSGH